VTATYPATAENDPVVEAHRLDTTNVHGIANTADLALRTDPDVVGFTHDQPVPAATWVITHGLGRKPALVAISDTAGTELQAGIHHPSDNETWATFLVPTAGKARLR
jgi:hypothetical protein